MESRSMWWQLVIDEGQFTSWTMISEHERWPFPMIWLDGPTSMAQFLKELIYKAFGPLTRCKSNLDKEEWHAPKVNMLISLVYAQNGQFPKRKKFQVWPFFLSSPVFIFSSPKKISLKKIRLYYHCSVMGPCLFLLDYLFCLSHRKTGWTMSTGNVGLKICLLRTSNSMVTLIFFSLV